MSEKDEIDNVEKRDRKLCHAKETKRETERRRRSKKIVGAKRKCINVKKWNSKRN